MEDPELSTDYPSISSSEESVVNKDVINNVEKGEDDLNNEVLEELGFIDGHTNTNPALA